MVSVTLLIHRRLFKDEIFHPTEASIADYTLLCGIRLSALLASTVLTIFQAVVRAPQDAGASTKYECVGNAFEML